MNRRHATFWVRALVGVAGSVLLTVGMAVAAFGHASTVGSDPADGAVLPTAPEVLSVTFSEQVSLADTGNQLLAADGSVEAADFAVRDNVVTIKPLDEIGPGTHIVTWRVVSPDSHPISGGFTFAVGAATETSVAISTTTTDRELVVARASAEALRYAGVLGLAGLGVFAAFVIPGGLRSHPRLLGRVWRTGLWLAAAGVGGSVFLVGLVAVIESGAPLGTVLQARVWGDGFDSAAGAAAGVSVLGTVVLLAGLGFSRPVWVGFGAAIGLSSLVLMGHTRSFGPSWLLVAADLAHVSAAALWWGGLMGLGLVLTLRPELRVGLRGLILARFSTLAGVAVVLLIAAGLVMYWRIGHSWGGLWETGYGRAVLVKCALMVPLLAAAGWNRMRLLPRLLTGGGDTVEGLLRRTLAAEMTLISAIVVATSVVVSLSPPARPPVVLTTAPTEQTWTLELSDQASAQITVAPLRRGTNSIHIAILDPDGSPMPIKKSPKMQVALKSADVGPFTVPLTPVGAAGWQTTAALPLPGEWTLTLAVTLSRFDQPVVSTPVVIP